MSEQADNRVPAFFSRSGARSGRGPNKQATGGLEPVDLSKCKSMVAWFHPALLFRAAFHSIIASLFGRYADRRTILQLEDDIPANTDDQHRFAKRYDYSRYEFGNEPFWVDYASDLGDGFDSTYAVSYMMAAPSLAGRTNPQFPDIAGVDGLSPDVELNAGKVLIMGGDQIYPWPSREAYAEKVQRPYSWALPPKPQSTAEAQGGGPDAEPDVERDVFAIPGNHDWYDGLNAFDGLFCRARGGRTQDNVGSIGGWRTRQHRSYFAIKLPHNWWIWGADISLSQYLDAGQLRYFQTVVDYMQPGDKFILCTAQPTWLYFGKPGERYARANLLSLINAPIREKNAKLCGIFSGDTHHYSRYNESDQLGDFNLFTAGGGGAYFHGTRHLKDNISFEWLGRDLTFSLNDNRKPQPAAHGDQPEPKKTHMRACYPSRAASCWRAMTNLIFPLRNVMFALAMGFIYWMLTWSLSELQVNPQFQMEEGAQELVIKETQEFQQQRQIRIQEMRKKRFGGERYRHWRGRSLDELNPPGSPERYVAPPPAPPPMPKPADAAAPKPIRDLTMGFWGAYLQKQKDITTTNADTPWYAKERLQLFGTFVLYMFGLLVLGLASSPLTTITIFLVWYIFFTIAETRRSGRLGQFSRFVSGTFHFLVHLTLMWALFIVFTYINEEYIFNWLVSLSAKIRTFTGGDEGFLFFLPIEVWPRILYIPEMIVIGGLLAGLAFGIYLALTYIVSGINDDWAFSAQASPDYRNFLRMKFERDKLTVYPIGLDHPPRHQKFRFTGRLSGWLAADDAGPGEPRVKPRHPLRPRLIEGPIEIDVNKVRNIPRR